MEIGVWAPKAGFLNFPLKQNWSFGYGYSYSGIKISNNTEKGPKNVRHHFSFFPKYSGISRYLDESAIWRMVIWGGLMRGRALRMLRFSRILWKSMMSGSERGALLMPPDLRPWIQGPTMVVDFYMDFNMILDGFYYDFQSGFSYDLNVGFIWFWCGWIWCR